MPSVHDAPSLRPKGAPTASPASSAVQPHAPHPLTGIHRAPSASSTVTDRTGPGGASTPRTIPPGGGRPGGTCDKKRLRGEPAKSVADGSGSLPRRRRRAGSSSTTTTNPGTTRARTGHEPGHEPGHGPGTNPGTDRFENPARHHHVTPVTTAQTSPSPSLSLMLPGPKARRAGLSPTRSSTPSRTCRGAAGPPAPPAATHSSPGLLEDAPVFGQGRSRTPAKRGRNAGSPSGRSGVFRPTGGRPPEEARSRHRPTCNLSPPAAAGAAGRRPRRTSRPDRRTSTGPRCRGARRSTPPGRP